MVINGNKIDKSDIFNFAREVGILVELLNGIIIQSKDTNKLSKIVNQKNKIEKTLIFFEPTIYDEYSEKVKILYLEMKKAREEYHRSVNEKYFEETVKELKSKYEQSVINYKNSKLIRDKIKDSVNNH